LAAERPAMLEGLSRELIERAGAAAVAAYRQAATRVAERAADRVQRLRAEAASSFGVPCRTSSLRTWIWGSPRSASACPG
jgi:hypothetical protein